MTDFKKDIIICLVIITLAFSGSYFIASRKTEIRQVCIEDYQYIIKKDGEPHKIIDKFDKGILCKKEK